jgi:hypothetical protein
MTATHKMKDSWRFKDFSLLALYLLSETFVKHSIARAILTPCEDRVANAFHAHL